MRFVWAVLALVLASILIVAGIFQRTVLLGPNNVQMEFSFTSTSPFVVIDSELLLSNSGTQTLLVRGAGDVFLAYGRTTDVHAWVASAPHELITLDDQGGYVVTPVAGSVPELPAPLESMNPAGSDLWFAEYKEQTSLIAPLQLQKDMSVIIASNGESNAPSDIVVTWPLDNSTPWVGPMILGGVLLLGLGIWLWMEALRFHRRGPGPKRKGFGPLPPTEPISRVQSPTGTIEIQPEVQAPPTRRARRNQLLALPAFGVSILLLSGCTSDVWPKFPEEATPSPSVTAGVPVDQAPPVVSEAQAARILQKIAMTVAEADMAMDADLLATRMSGTPLEERKTDYLLREKLDDRAIPAGIPTERISILLPQAFEGWPRTVMMLTESTSEPQRAPVIVMMTQENPWQSYRINYLGEMLPAVTMPNLAPAWLGSQLVPPDSPFMRIAPNQVAVAFADLVDSDETSQYVSMFDDETHGLVTSLLESRQGVVDALVEHGAANTSKVEFEIRMSELGSLSLGTLDGGAIVAVDVIDWERVTPTKTGAVIQLNNQEAIALTGVKEASKGVETKYSLQLFFAVPSSASTDPVRLLAVHQKLVSVEVIK